MGVNKVLLLEKSDNHSTTIRSFYKDNKRVDKDWNNQVVEIEGSIDFRDGTKEWTLNLFDELIAKNQIDAFFNEEVERVVSKNSMFEIMTIKNKSFWAKSVIIAIGKMGKPNRPDYQIPAGIKDRVNFNLDKCSKDEQILVVGGGNSAVEYAIDLADTNDVALCYRQKGFTRLNAQNLLNLNRAVSHGKMRQLLGVNITSLEEIDAKVKVNFEEINYEKFDRVIYAIGGTTPIDFLKRCGIELNRDGVPILDEHYQTNINGLYISGDIVFKNGGSIAIALNMSYRIIKHINR
jgi:thioredoxin reductase (NADPH)